MRKQGPNKLTILTTLLGAMLFAAGTANAKTKEVLFARVSGQTQCDKYHTLPPMSSALESLERTDAVIIEAKFASLNNKVFCKSCSCHTNLFHLAKVNTDDLGIELAQDKGWEIVDSKDIGKADLSKIRKSESIKDDHYKTLPVIERY